MAGAEHIDEIIRDLRTLFDDEFCKSCGKKQRFMYGGGVTLESAKKLIDLKSINGIGMGRASLNYNFFTGVIKLISNIV